MSIPTAQRCLEDITKAFADIQTSLLVMGGSASGATPDQNLLANNLSDDLAEVENDSLKRLKESFA